MITFKKRIVIMSLALAFISGTTYLVNNTQDVRAAATITVNHVATDAEADDGNCTLREAITAANSDTASGATPGECIAGVGTDTIEFNISGTGLKTISPTSALPDISEAVTIDGYTQTGAAENTAPSPEPFNGTLVIELDGSNAGASNGLRITAGNTTIRGLIINDFQVSGIVTISDANNNIIAGNYIGTDSAGTADRGNTQFGVSIGSDSNVVGGTTPASRNVISGNTRSGVAMDAESNTVQGNYIGVSADGTSVISNGSVNFHNVSITAASDNLIGGSADGATNVISGTGSGSNGIVIIGHTGAFGAGSLNNVIQGNYIGTNPDGEVEAGFGNDNAGVLLFGEVQNTLVGGVAEGEGNIIAGNGAGVGSTSVATFGASNNSIVGNSIHSNDGTNGILTLGIDLFDNDAGDFATLTDIGVNANDVDDEDGSSDESNAFMNYPVISAVSSENGEVTITYSLDINDSETGATGYRVEFFANDVEDDSGNGEGQTLLGADIVAGDVANRSVTLALPDGVEGNKFLSSTTTMTDASDDGFGHTSEFGGLVEADLVAATADTATEESSDATLADTGQNSYIFLALASVLLISPAVYLRKRYSQK